MSEKEILTKINALKRDVNNPENDYAPLVAQEKLDEITELEYMLNEIRKDKIKITPIINASTVAERPKGRDKRRMCDGRLFI